MHRVSKPKIEKRLSVMPNEMTQRGLGRSGGKRALNLSFDILEKVVLVERNRNQFLVKISRWS